ncbi:MAG: hypothetical protein IPL84_10020 [Chitinophagaceae bacterium]|nr:hypothetical protein [Chitinophagaceae bacterium]
MKDRKTWLPANGASVLKTAPLSVQPTGATLFVYWAVLKYNKKYNQLAEPAN